MSRQKGRLRIGTSGYHYDHWKAIFYPEGLPQRQWLSHYARHFDTVELNSTFYRLPHAEIFASRHKQAPQGFLYALKFSRYGSHIVRLKKSRSTIKRFLRRADRLADSLGPILVQLPPRWKANPERLAAFLGEAPRRYRWAVEFRDPRWLNEEVFAVLQDHGAALCIHDMIDRHPQRLTAGWTYLRFHGKQYGGSYSKRFLSAKAHEIDGYLSDGFDVFAYFNNDAHGYAVQNAADLKRYVSGDKARVKLIE